MVYSSVRQASVDVSTRDAQCEKALSVYFSTDVHLREAVIPPYRISD